MCDDGAQAEAVCQRGRRSERTKEGCPSLDKRLPLLAKQLVANGLDSPRGIYDPVHQDKHVFLGRLRVRTSRVVER
eukprot:9499451-Pyramimonas_sp.AAC.1